MLWRPRRAVLEAYDAELADNRESLPPPIWRAAKDLLAFGLGRADPRALIERLAPLAAAADLNMSALFSQIVCEMLCSLGDLDRAVEYLALADRGNLSGWQWIEACPALGPLCDFTLQMTHHPPNWLHEEARGKLSPPGRWGNNSGRRRGRGSDGLEGTAQLKQYQLPAGTRAARGLCFTRTQSTRIVASDAG